MPPGKLHLQYHRKMSSYVYFVILQLIPTAQILVKVYILHGNNSFKIIIKLYFDPFIPIEFLIPTNTVLDNKDTKINEI